MRIYTEEQRRKKREKDRVYQQRRRDGLRVPHLDELQSQASVARELGISRQAVQKTEQRALAKLRPLLDDFDLGLRPSDFITERRLLR